MIIIIIILTTPAAWSLTHIMHLSEPTQPEYQYWHLCPICLNLHAFSLDIWVFDLILDLMHMNSAYFSGIVLMHALFCNLDYWLWYQKTFLRTLISA